jgi:hypothetical protein
MTPASVTRMSERELLDAVVDAARLLGWRVMHQRPGRTLDGWRTAIQGHPGFPDLVLLRPPRLIFAELKTKRGRVHFDQATWLNGLDVVPGVEQYVWRPIDWEAGRIEDALR